MNGLKTLEGLNAKAVAKELRQKNADNPHATFHGDATTGIVICTPFGRRTTFIGAGPASVNFLAKWTGANAVSTRDALVESLIS